MDDSPAITEMPTPQLELTTLVPVLVDTETNAEMTPHPLRTGIGGFAIDPSY